MFFVLISGVKICACAIFYAFCLSEISTIISDKVNHLPISAISRGGSWTKWNPLKQARYFHGCAAISGKVVVECRVRYPRMEAMSFTSNKQISSGH